MLRVLVLNKSGVERVEKAHRQTRHFPINMTTRNSRIVCGVDKAAAAAKTSDQTLTICL